MTTVSYPAEGNNGFNVAQWAQMFSAEDGIINDYTGGAFLMTRNSTTNVATIATGYASINGYVLEVTAPEDLAVGTAAGTYHIWAKYDPTLNVADPVTGNRSTLGPCRLGISTGPPTSPNGESYVLLYTITRATGQALTAATVTDYRHWIGPNAHCNILPPGEKAFPRVPVVGFGPYPVGTSMFESTTGNLYRLFSPDEFLEWVSITDTPILAFPAPGALVAWSTGPSATYRKVAGEVMLSGTLQRSSGANLSTGSEVTLGTLPVGYRPKLGRGRFLCYGVAAGGDVVLAPVVVYNTTGIVEMQVTSYAIKWIDLSMIQFRGE